MHFLYILRSLKDNGYYIGTTNDTSVRLKEHNSGKTKSTKSRAPFIIAYSEKFHTKSDAIKKEIHLKKSYQAKKELLNSIGFNIK